MRPSKSVAELAKLAAWSSRQVRCADKTRVSRWQCFSGHTVRPTTTQTRLSSQSRHHLRRQNRQIGPPQVAQDNAALLPPQAVKIAEYSLKTLARSHSLMHASTSPSKDLKIQSPLASAAMARAFHVARFAISCLKSAPKVLGMIRARLLNSGWQINSKKDT